MDRLPTDRLLGSGPLTILWSVLAGWLLYKVIQRLRRLAHSHTAPLAGPPNPSFMWGVGQLISDELTPGLTYEQWAEKYGPVYRVPASFGYTRVVLCDPKAVQHFYSRETFGYQQTELFKRLTENIVGRGILWAEAEDHRRQRKALSPAFSNANLRRLSSVFFDSGYKVKTAWDEIISSESESGDFAVIEVQSWMNHVSLDIIGIAGFSHDFGTLRGQYSAVAATFEAISNFKPTLLDTFTFVVGLAFPIVMKLPTPTRRIVGQLNTNMGEISDTLLENSRKEREGESATEDNSIIDLLIKAESSESGLRLSQEEVLAQMKVLTLAGYETTSVSLTWCLIELCKNLEIQSKLRAELLPFSNTDPSWEQFTNGLPYLDAVVHETLRLHAPTEETTRVATEDDIIPLSSPIKTASGSIVDRISITKGEIVTVPLPTMNTSTTLWGPDAKEFIPERWLKEDGIPKKAQEIQGHRHLLTFSDGPRICLGRGFALAEFKAVLSVLIRNYAFEFTDGPSTKIERVQAIFRRPAISGQQGPKVPLLVRRLE